MDKQAPGEEDRAYEGVALANALRQGGHLRAAHPQHSAGLDWQVFGKLVSRHFCDLASELRVTVHWPICIIRRNRINPFTFSHRDILNLFNIIIRNLLAIFILQCNLWNLLRKLCTWLCSLRIYMSQSSLYIDALFLLHGANICIIDIRMAKILFVLWLLLSGLVEVPNGRYLSLY